MTDVTMVAGDASARAPKPEAESKIVERLLKRARGASLTELAEATAWQQHSIRACLTGLRKKGNQIVREPRKSGGTAYRIAKPQPQKATDAQPE